ncbi:MAG: winged helix-turn-helix domain-containing protein [Hyphomicrobiaceae bacterium]|nr:MAG: winged helix-turn-helix domain-containing protein [Hyphomicrobiaceae bacterium]
MTIVPTGTPSSWQERTCYAAAALFSLASGGTNFIYGWTKGTDTASSLVWASVSVGVSIIFALSWPAFIVSLDRRQWARALMVLVALVVTGIYSVSAALGSAMGGRANAAATETATTGARQKSQAAYDAAQAELGTLKPSRSVAELEALVEAAKPQCRILVLTGSRTTVCTKPAALTAELGRAKRRAELEARMATASAELAKTGPARIANSDAVALAAYLQGLGIDATADRINKLLVLLAVLVIECGGGLALAVGMALGQGQTGRREETQGTQQVTQGTMGVPSGVTLVQQLPLPQAFPGAPQRFTETVEAALVRMLRERGGQIVAGQRTLGRTLGVSATHINRVLAKLSEAGVISLDATRRGSVVRLNVAGTA